jgi:hypothetical protein
MTTPAEQAANRLSRRLHRIESAVNIQRTRADGDAEAIDFDLGFPEGAMVEIGQRRMSGSGKTSVIIRPDGMVETFVIRYPPLPADDVAEPQLLAGMREMAATLAAEERIGIRLPEKHLDVRIQPGEIRNLGSPGGVKAWWPHVEYGGIAPVEVGADDFADFLVETYKEYRNRYFDRTKIVYK